MLFSLLVLPITGATKANEFDVAAAIESARSDESDDGGSHESVETDADTYGPSVLQDGESQPRILQPLHWQWDVAKDSSILEGQEFFRETSPLRQTALLQPTPFLDPQLSVEATAPAAPGTLTARLFQDSDIDRSVLRRSQVGVASFSRDRVRGAEAAPVVSKDLGSLLRKSRTTPSVSAQRRNPVTHDPRVRGSRIGSLAANGSYWVPARQDLDTAVSKIDSRLVSDVVIIPGPYSSLYGPGFNFVDFELLSSPRFENGNRVNGQTSFDHNSNGNQWLGQQSFWAGGRDWGARVNYSHRLGSDYRAGNGLRIASSYESREFTVAMGRDFRDRSSLELSLLRLDQTDVEFPGYVFDIDFLVTDGYEVAYVDPTPAYGDRVETEIWYNRTRFEGNAQNFDKRAQFPLLNTIAYVGFTDVDSMSTGYRRARTWGTDSERGFFTLGHDLRFVKQELNEIASGVSLGLPFPFANRNSPIPRSFSVNPGIFASYTEDFLDQWTFETGGRVDYVQTDIVDDPVKLQEVGLAAVPATYEEIIGTSQSQTDRVMWSLYGSLTRRHCDCLTTSASLGYAQRPPNLTELYAAQPFLLVLQNGLNNVTGDPRLKREQLIQADLSFDFDGEYLRTGARGFYGWAFDYITFENTNLVTDAGEVQQVSLRYVNTSLATLAGFESFVELMPKRAISPFATIKYVNGRDRTRNGDFATTNGESGIPSTRVDGLPRGFFSAVTGADSEPLPGIAPLEATVGVRIKDPRSTPAWNIDFSARIVDNQDRVATSLLETPTPGFTVFDIRGTYRPVTWDGLFFVAGVENFTDKSYREHLDFRSPNGISVFQPGVNAYFGSELTY